MRAPEGYELGSAFARDKTGVYYRAHQTRLNRAVTIKALREDPPPGDAARALFDAERRLMMTLEHPGLLLTIDTGEADGIPYFVTESVAEPTLQEALKGDEPLPEVRAVRITLALARALHYLAGRGLLYKNVSPKNVLLPRPAAPKFLTFRNVRALTEAASFRGANVQSGAYCAPELMRDDLGPVTAKTNVYALGCLLYEMLAGTPPAGREGGEARAAHAEGRFPSLKERRPFLRDRAHAVVSRLIQHDPVKRADPGAAVALLEAYQSDPLLTRPLKPGVRRGLRRRRSARRGRTGA